MKDLSLDNRLMEEKTAGEGTGAGVVNEATNDITD